MARLLAELPHKVEVPEELMERALVLDNFRIPMRYPGGSRGAPFEHYGRLQSEEAIGYTRSIP